MRCNQETFAIEKIVCYSSFLRGGGHARQGHRGKNQGQSGGRRIERKMWARAFIVVSEEKGRHSRVSRLRTG